ncbi:MAG TPA: energy transducer TonB [Burkholderiales bacterium]|nr:energy transducer TonB [Burkholderiales bacterium]
MSVASAGVFEERLDPGRFASAVLAAAVHLALLAILVFGVRWQNRPPEAVSVELWEPPPPAPVVEAPRPVPAPEPAPVVVKPEVVKPEPVVPKPEIVEKKAPPPKHKPEPKPAPKAEPAKPRVDETQKRIREELAREQASLAVDRERQQIRDQLAREASVAQMRDYEAYAGRIKAKIRGNIVLPPELKGNPEAIFDVVQLPTGEVLSVKLRKSSGHAAYDGAVERAILKSSPLPRPDKPELFQRSLELKFRPLD